MTKKNGVNHSMQLSCISRRKRSLERLELQLKAGQKPKKDCKELVFVDLTDADKNRIKKEIEILKSRI